MGELWFGAGAPRATRYRLFPGKSALFPSLLLTYSPLEPVTSLISSMGDQPPDVVAPEIARTVARTVYGSGGPRIGLLRAIFLELSSLSPDSEDAARDLLAATLGSAGAYVMQQMMAGRARREHPPSAPPSANRPDLFSPPTPPPRG